MARPSVNVWLQKKDGLIKVINFGKVPESVFLAGVENPVKYLER